MKGAAKSQKIQKHKKNPRKLSIERILKADENKTKEEISLEETLFGKDILNNSNNKAIDVADNNIEFIIDTNASRSTEVVRTTVWHDEDDDDLEIDLTEKNRLKKLKLSNLSEGKDVVTGNSFQKMLQERYEHQQHAWATRNLDDVVHDVLDNDDLALLNQSNSMTQRQTHNPLTPLPPGNISIKRLADATIAEPSSSAITATHFHPNNELFLVASQDKHLKVFKIDEDKNEKQIGLQFKDLMVRSAKFVGSDGEIIVSGRKPYYYSYDGGSGKLTKLQLPAGSQTKTLESMEVSPEGSKMAFLGSEGYVHIADGRSKQWIGDLKMNCTSRAVTFLDEVTCVTSGFDADLYIWDLRYSHRPRCVTRFHHEDGTPTSTLAAYVPRKMAELNNGIPTSTPTPEYYHLSEAYLNVATMSGVTSVFEGSVSNNTSNSSYYSFGDEYAPKPLKTVMNLTTKITTSAFHPSGQILAIASNEKKDQLKLIHVPSCSVFSNWPIQSTPLHKVETIDFSPNGQYMTVGNQRGKVLLFKLNHFSRS